ncbi:Myo-inositol transporter [Pleurostoma richardsiae]|uniref:Myo-inositol transporter n=1 Tax=Pleurostoma richardsiae TaxID=41990 RepID=A0AA38RV69_9PEZI|nr:Myo-inositol transporter [Pleurostoma richardsiae]
MSSQSDPKSMEKNQAALETPSKIDGEAISAVSHIEKIGSHGDATFDDSIEETRTSRAVWLIIATVAMGGFLFGYDTGVISAVLVNLGDDLGHELSSSEKELVTSLTSGGALIGSLIAGLPADRFGRKFGINVGCILFLVGSVIQASAFSIVQMSVGRFVVGLGVGSAAMIIPLYIGELAPSRHRGQMIAFDNMSVTLGQLISYALGAAFTEVSRGWRYMVAVGGVPPIILFVLLMLCPESPRYLISRDKIEEATGVISRVFPEASREQVRAKVNIILWNIETEAQTIRDKSLWWKFKQLHCVPANLRALVVACTVMAVSQLGGFNTLMYYSATIFSLVGFSKATAVSIVVGGTNFVFTLASMFVLDRLGRRLVLLVTLLGMALSMVVTAAAFHYIPVSESLELTTDSVNWAGIVVLVTIIFYVAFFGGGVATIAWVGTELLPLEVRALGTTMNAVVCWAFNIILASTFLTMMKSLTPSGAFGFYAGVCFFGWLFVLFCYPEAKGLPLEEVGQIFEHGFGVKRAAQMQREAKTRRQAGVI